MKVQVESRKLGATEWAIRNKLGEDNYSYRSGHLTIEQLIVKAETVRHRWMAMATEAGNEFRIGVYSLLENGAEFDISTFANARDQNRLRHAARGLRVIA